MTTIPLALHGKIPAAGDFVRHRAHPGDIELIDRCCAAWSERLGGDPGSFREAGPVGSLLRAGEHWLAAVWLPSHDAVGRPYPLVVYGRVPRRALGSEAMDLAGLLLDLCQAVLGRVQPERLAELDPGAGLTLELAVGRAGSDRAEALLRSATCERLWQESWGDDAEAASARALASLVAASQERTEAVRIDGVVSLAHVVFWLNAAWLLRTAMGGGEALPSLVTLHPTWRGGPPRLHLAWGAYGPERVASCIWPLPERHQEAPRAVCAPGAVSVPGWLRRALAQDAAGAADLLYALGHPEMA